MKKATQATIGKDVLLYIALTLTSVGSVLLGTDFYKGVIALFLAGIAVFVRTYFKILP